MTTVYFVRHAEPNYNNHDDSLRELSAKGLKDRKLVTAFLADKGIDVALSSPYKRAIDTIRDFTDSVGLPIDIIFKENEIYNRAMLFRPNSQIEFYDKRALWGWDKDNFAKGSKDGIFEMEGIKFGIRICFEIRFPEFFRELYKRNTDIDLVLFYDVADIDDKERYDLIKGHLQTRAVENVTTTISVNAISPFQTAPTMVLGKSGQCLKECVRNKPGFLIYDFEKTENDFGEKGRTSISDELLFV